MATTQRQKTTFGGSVTGLSSARLAGFLEIEDWAKITSERSRPVKPSSRWRWFGCCSLVWGEEYDLFSAPL